MYYIDNYFYHYSTTIYTQYCVLVKAHEDAGNYSFGKEFTYNHFRWSWYSFLKLLDIDIPSGFMCSDCGVSPDIVLMDATSLAFCKDFLQWKPGKATVKKQVNLEDKFCLTLIPSLIDIDTFSFVCILGSVTEYTSLINPQGRFFKICNHWCVSCGFYGVDRKNEDTCFLPCQFSKSCKNCLPRACSVFRRMAGVSKGSFSCLTRVCISPSII